MNFTLAWLTATTVATLLGLVLAMAGGLTRADAFLALGAGALAGTWHFFRIARIPHRASRAIGPWEWAAIILFALFSLRAFLWLATWQGDELRVLSPNNLGDLSIHLTFINYLAGGVTLPAESPIFSGAPLTYPFGTDLLNSLLSLAGVETVRGLVWVGLAGCAATGLALWRWGGAFALAAFLCNGGFFALKIFAEGGALRDFQADAAWKSFPLALLVTQRGFLHALPAGLVLMASWRARFFESSAVAPRPQTTQRVVPLWLELLLYASMPLFHLHTFLFLSALLATWFVCFRETRRHLAILVGAALVPATALTLLVTGNFHGSGLTGWQLGWMQGTQPFLDFWAQNFGILPLLIAWLLWLIWKKRAWREAGAFVFPALAVFLACCVYRFAPWEWDNTKLMVWSYLAVMPALWRCVVAPRSELTRVALCALLFFSGLLSLLGGLGTRYAGAPHYGFPLAQRSELDLLTSALRTFPRDARFIGRPTYNHPLLLLGRPMVMGYSGHLSSHGLDFTREAVVDSILRGEPGWREKARGLGARYLFFGRLEEEIYPDSTHPWRDALVPVVIGEFGEIYDLAPEPVG